MYSLILTLVLSGVNAANVAVSVHNIDGFSSEASCLRAGNAWINQQKALNLNYHNVHPRAMCVRK